MICNCNNNSSNSGSAATESGLKISHVYGNVFRLGIPLSKRIVEYNGGIRSQEDLSLEPLLDGGDIKVVFSKGGAVRYEFDASLVDGYVVVEDKGTLPIGTYSITVLATDANGDPLRYKENLVMRIVDATADADYNSLEQYDGYFKFPILKFGGGKYSNVWVRADEWVRELSWKRN